MRTIDLKTLEDAAWKRGLSLSGLARQAGVADKTLLKIRRAEPVQASVARRLNDALLRIAELDQVESTA